MANNGLFGTGYGFQVGRKTTAYVVGSSHTNKYDAKSARDNYKAHGAKSTRIEKIGNLYVVYFMPGAKQNRNVKKGFNHIKGA